MHRFYSAEPISGDTTIISDSAQVHHIRDVLRMKSGERLVIFNGTGKEYVAEISSIGRSQIQARVIMAQAVQALNSKLVIACALPKLGRMDEIVDALTQIGVDAVIPMVTERTIVRLDEASKKARLNRWRKIAMSAAKQSQRLIIPDVVEVMTFDEVVRQSLRYDLRLIATLCVTTKPLRDVGSLVGGGGILALIGPEGDFTTQEVETAIKAEFKPVSLGKNVLRVATAATVLAAYIILSGFRPE